MRRALPLPEGPAINKDKQALDEHAVPPRDALDIDDIVADDVTPFLTLEVGELTSGNDGRGVPVDEQPDDAASRREPATYLSSPAVTPGEDDLDVYGWESPLWRKILGYLGLYRN